MDIEIVKKPRILIIDDSEEDQKIIEKALKEMDYDLFFAKTGKEGLLQAKRFYPEIIISDWLIPEMDGIELCQKIRKDEQLGSVYFILLTVMAEQTDKIQALNSGADEYLTKPFDPRELKAKVKNGMRLRAMQREIAELQHKQALSELAATVGHRINNPLTSIIGILEITQRRIKKGEYDSISASLDKCLDQADRIANIVKQMINLSTPKLTTYLDDQQMLDLQTRFEEEQ